MGPVKLKGIGAHILRGIGARSLTGEVGGLDKLKTLNCGSN